MPDWLASPIRSLLLRASRGTIEIREVINMPAEYMNTDLDLVAAFELQDLSAALCRTHLHELARWTDDQGLRHLTFETNDYYDDPESTILDTLEAISQLNAEEYEMWERCDSRTLDVGYESGYSGSRIKHEITVPTLDRIVRSGLGLRITVYPLHGSKRLTYPGLLCTIQNTWDRSK